MKANPGGKHSYNEAFCLMQYQDELGNVEVIWNSRDGVTPFTINTRAGREARHVRWHEDRYAPEHKPRVGDRIFVTLTPERAAAKAETIVARLWGNSMAEHYTSKEAAVAAVAKDLLDYGGGGAPDLIEVEEPKTEAQPCATA